MMFRIPILFGAVWVVCIVGARAQDRHAIAVSGQQRALVEFRGDTMEVMILSENQTDTQAVVLGEMVATAQVEAADYNGDGYADFSVQFLGDRYHTPHRWRIFLFQPSAGRFREVPLPEGNGHVGRPTGFLNPYFLEEEGILFVQADYTRVLQDQREMYRRQGWKFTPQGEVYLAESLRPVGRDAPWTALVPLTAVHTVFNRAGDTVHSGAVYLFSPTDDMEPVILPVEQERLYLHDAPQPERRSAMYLVKGDHYEVLDYVEKGWLKIRYVNPARGNIDKYITVMEASSNRLDFYREVFAANDGLELTVGDLGMAGDTDSVYAALLYMGAKNSGTHLETFEAEGVYLLYRPKAGDEAYRVWQVSSHKQSYPIPGAGEVAMWADNFVVWKDGAYVLDGAADGGMFLPSDISPGDYDYRIAMVNRRHDLALVSNAAMLRLPLPKVVWDIQQEQYRVQPLSDNH